MKPTTPTRKIRQFKAVQKQLNRLIKAGKLEELSTRKRDGLWHRFHRLYQDLSRLVSQNTLRLLCTGSVALLLGLGFPSTVDAQAFGTPLVNPFGLTPNTNIAYPAVSDIDNDGDLDLFCGDYDLPLRYFENIGTATTPAFAQAVTNPFGIIITADVAVPVFADIDNDGDDDLFIGSGDSATNVAHLRYQENIGTATNPSFSAPQPNPFGLAPTSILINPSIVDLDADGDLDIFAGGLLGDFYYFENTGSATNPAFAAPVVNPFGVLGFNDQVWPALGDLDRDGDYDLLVSYYSSPYIHHFENTGTPSSPAFTNRLVNSFGVQSLPHIFYYFMPIFADLDNDSDLDIIVGELYGDIVYYGDTAAIVNTAPTIIAPPNDTTCRDSVLGPLAFTADDVNGDALSLFATSNNQSVVPDANLTISGTQPNFAIEVLPAFNQAGLATISLSAVDGIDTTTTSFDVEVEVCFAGIREAYNVQTWDVYPNPTTGELRYELTFAQPRRGMKVTVYDFTGRMMVSLEDQDHSHQFSGELDLSGFPPGLYVVQFATEYIQLHRRIRVE